MRLTRKARRALLLFIVNIAITGFAVAFVGALAWAARFPHGEVSRVLCAILNASPFGV